MPARPKQRPFPRSGRRRSRTLFHILFGLFLDEVAPSSVEIVPEPVFNRMPQRPDFLLLRRRARDPSRRQARGLRKLWGLFRTEAIVEYKSPSRPVRKGDLDQLLAHGATYFARHAGRLRERETLALFLIVPGLSPTLREDVGALRWNLRAAGGGYHAIERAPYTTFIVSLEEVAEAERNHLLRLFVHRRIEEAPRTAVEWFVRRTARSEDWPMRAEHEKEIRKALLRFPPSFFKDVLKKLPASERLKGLSPEERLEGVPPEEQLLALSDDFLRQLPKELIDRQPPRVRSKIRRRIRAR